MNKSAQSCLKLQESYLRINFHRFHYLKFILEGYDGLAMLSSYDSKNGIVRLRYPEEMARELFALLADLAPDISPFRIEK